MSDNVVTVLMDFCLNESCFEDVAFSRTEFIKFLLSKSESILETTFHQLAKTKHSKVSKYIYSSENDDATVMFKIYSKEISPNHREWLTMTLEYSSPTDSRLGFESNFHVQTFTDAAHKKLSELRKKEVTTSGNILPIIQRAKTISPYYTTSDDRLIEYGFKDVILDTFSQFQHIQILQTEDHGKILVLDGAINLAECDTVAYTHHLMDLKNESQHYQDSRVLILGGGDGGLLKELIELKEPPKEIIMVELDEEVIAAASKHLRSICGPYLDSDRRVGANYKVIIGDALKVMEDYLANGETFDYVFGDLTDVPVDASVEKQTTNSYLASPHRQADVWIFLQQILEMGVRLIRPITGKYLTHCNGKNVPDVLDKYNTILDKIWIPPSSEFPLGLKCDFSRSESFVPSFMEVWTFYQLKMVPPSIDG